MVTELDDYQMPEGSGTTIGKCLTFAEIEGLLAAERERCAAVLDNMEAEAQRKAKTYAGCEYEIHHRRRARTAQIAADRIRNLPPHFRGGQS